jgi:hypothetical protein
MFHGVRVGLDFDIGLGEACFTFVGYDHFHEGFFRMRGHEWRYHIDRERMHGFYGRSVIRNDFRRDEHGRFVNNGIGRDRMERVTRGRVEHSNFEERNPVGDRERLAKEGSGMGKDTGHPGVGGMGNTGHPGMGGMGNSGHPNTGSISKVYRPPTPASKPATASSQKKK